MKPVCILPLVVALLSASASAQVWRNVASNVCTQAGKTTTNGTSTDGNAKIRHTIWANTGTVKLVYQNGCDSTIAVTSSLAGVRVTFGGANEVSIGPDQTIESDPVSISLVYGQLVYSITHVRLISGTKWPVDYYCDNTNAEAKDLSTIDRTCTNWTAKLNGVCYGPSAIIAEVDPSYRSELWIGDSILQGLKTTKNRDFASLKYWYTPSGVPMIKSGWGGDTIAVLAEKQLRLSMAPYCSRVVSEYGANDLNTTQSMATIKARYQSLWAELQSQGLEVGQITVMPRVSTVDGGTTITGQTPLSPHFISSDRRDFNDWIRAGADQGIIPYEAAYSVEEPGDPNKWMIDIAEDGIHPGDYGAALIAAGLQ